MFEDRVAIATAWSLHQSDMDKDAGHWKMLFDFFTGAARVLIDCH